VFFVSLDKMTLQSASAFSNWPRALKETARFEKKMVLRGSREIARVYCFTASSHLCSVTSLFPYLSVISNYCAVKV
jgi:hypothetical protein